MSQSVLSRKPGKDSWLLKLKKKNSFRLKSTITWYKGLISVLVAATILTTLYLANNPSSMSLPFAKTSDMKITPTEDILRDNVIGYPNNENLYENVDDGFNFFSADDKRSYVYIVPEVSHASHTTGYQVPLEKAKSIEYLQINSRVFSSGIARVLIELYEGNTLIGKTNEIEVEGWENIAEVFIRPQINNPQSIRTKLVFLNIQDNTQSGYTQIWIKLGIKK